MRAMTEEPNSNGAGYHDYLGGFLEIALSTEYFHLVSVVACSSFRVWEIVIIMKVL